MEPNILSVGVSKQRIFRTEEQILAILDEFEKSGFSAKEYCEVSEINDATFYSWLKKYRSKPDDEGVKGFTPIEVTPLFRDPKPRLFAKIGELELYQEVPVAFLKALMS